MTDQTMTPEQALTRAQTLVGKLRGKHVAGSLSLDEQMELGLCWQTLRAALSRPVVPEGLVAGYAAVYEGRICHEFFNATPEGLRADTVAAGYDAPEAIVALYPKSVKDERDAARAAKNLAVTLFESIKRERDALHARIAELEAQLADYRENGASAVRYAPTSAHWSRELRRLFGDDARAGIDKTE